MTSGIYKITHESTDRIYVGSAVNISQRWYTHKTELRGNRHSNQRLQNSWNKHGESEFRFSVIEECKPELLIEHEQYWIDELNPYYNIARIAGSQLGYKHTDETKQIIREKRANQIIPTGLKRSEESRMNISNGHKGIPCSDNAKEKLRQYGAKAAHESKTDNWIVITPDGEKLEIRNLREFCRKNNLTAPNMVSVSQGKRTHHKGWKCEKIN